MSLVRAIDTSRWSGDISSGQWDHVKKRGYDLSIVGSWHGKHANNHAEKDLHNSKNAGMIIATYVVLNHLPAKESLDRAQKLCGEAFDHLKFIALDIEVDVEQSTIVDALQILAKNTIPVIIYTGRWFWRGKFGNPTFAQNVPLWASIYDGKEDLVFQQKNWFGGWNMLTGKQFQGTTSRMGIKGDLSVFDRVWINSLSSI